MAKKLIIILLPVVLYGSDFGYNFLKMPMLPSQAVFGPSLVATTQPAAYTVNPSAIPEDREAVLSLNSYIDGIKYGQIAFATSGMGFHINFLNSGKIPRIDEEGVYQGDFQVNFINAGVSRVVSRPGGIPIGVQGNITVQQIYNDMSVGITFAAGVNYTTTKFFMGRLNLGASIRNVGVEVKKFKNSGSVKMPIELQSGVYWEATPSFGIGAGLAYSIDYGPSFSLATSFNIQKYVVARVGFNSKGLNYRVGVGRDIISGMNFGLHLGPIKNVSIEYGYSPLGALGDAHRLEVIYNL